MKTGAFGPTTQGMGDVSRYFRFTKCVTEIVPERVKELVRFSIVPALTPNRMNHFENAIERKRFALMLATLMRSFGEQFGPSRSAAAST